MFAEPGGLADVVQRVPEECVRIVLPGPGNPVSLYIDPIRGAQTEVAGRVFEAVTFHVSPARVVVLHKDQRVHDMSACNIVHGGFAAVVSSSAPSLKNAGNTPVASNAEFDFVPCATREDVRKVEAQYVVPLHHIRIAFNDDTDKLLQHAALIHFAPVNHMLPPPVISQSNEDDPVPGP